MPTASIRRVTTALTGAKPERVFLVVAVLFGFIFVFLTPPFGVADEPAHFYRSYQISEADVYPMRSPAGGQYGGLLPENLVATTNGLLGNLPFRLDQKVTLGQLWERKGQTIDTTKRVPAYYTNTAVYGPLSYLPQAVGIFLSRLLPGQPNFLLTFYVARLCNFAVGVILLYWAIKKLPFAKWGIVILFLAPIAVFQMASLSPDVLTFGLTMLGVSFGLACLYPKRTLSHRELVYLGALTVAIAMLRVPYSGLAIIPFGVMFYHLRSHATPKKTWLITAGVAAVSALWVLSWQHYFGSNVALTSDPTVVPRQQVGYLFNIAHMIRVWGQTHLSGFFDLGTNGVGMLGWMDTAIPQWAITGYCFFLIASFFVSKTGEVRLERHLRLAFWVLFLALFLALDIIEYVFASPVGSNVILGIQGRYYIAMLALLAIACYGAISLSSKEWKKFHIYRLVFVGITNVVAVLIILNRYWLGIK